MGDLNHVKCDLCSGQHATIGPGIYSPPETTKNREKWVSDLGHQIVKNDSWDREAKWALQLLQFPVWRDCVGSREMSRNPSRTKGSPSMEEKDESLERPMCLGITGQRVHGGSVHLCLLSYAWIVCVYLKYHMSKAKSQGESNEVWHYYWECIYNK